MWTCTTAVLIFFLAASCLAGGSLKLKSIKLGDDCKSGVCTVTRGCKADFRATLHVDEEEPAKSESLGVTLLTLTLKWDDGTVSVNQATTCPKTGGSLVIDGINQGLCSVTMFAPGTMTVNPYTITVPNPGKSVSTHLKIYAYAKWSDDSESKDYRIGSISVNLK